MFQVALDVLPVQASSVPCERVFSSSKETDTLRRSNLSPAVFEVPQILKFSLRQERLNFTGNWLSREEELVALDIPPDTINVLMTEGRLDQLFELINEAQRCAMPLHSS